MVEERTTDDTGRGHLVSYLSWTTTTWTTKLTHVRRPAKHDLAGVIVLRRSVTQPTPSHDQRRRVGSVGRTVARSDPDVSTRNTQSFAGRRGVADHDVN